MRQMSARCGQKICANAFASIGFEGSKANNSQKLSELNEPEVSLMPSK